MSKRTDFLDADGSTMTIEGRADHENWAIKFSTTYREVTPGNAPAIALAILEAAGIQSADDDFDKQIFGGSEKGAEYAVMWLRNLAAHTETKGKEAAEREALEGEAWKLYTAPSAKAHPAYDSLGEMTGSVRDFWMKVPKVARELHGART